MAAAQHSATISSPEAFSRYHFALLNAMVFAVWLLLNPSLKSFCKCSHLEIIKNGHQWTPIHHKTAFISSIRVHSWLKEMR